ncbi:MAG TPA: serine hydrolase domain-containing protein, partial [Bacteroidia bacterium]|nr:serine hydrolase domain-containing protein [Bacteroidia bacterium]
NYNEHEPGAVILIAKNGQPIFRKAYGLANMELNIPNKPENVFQIASNSKQFTAVCVLQLVQQGKLDLKADIRTYIPTYNSHGRTITLEHLLCQTSGIPSYTELKNYEPNRTLYQTREELLNSFMNDSLLFEPGSDWSYSNSNYTLAAMIVEKVAGLSFGYYLKKNIFNPLQMQHTCLETNDSIIPGKVNGYTNANNGGYKLSAFEDCSWNMGAGGICSNVDDLLRWDNALYSEKIVKRDLLNKAWTTFVLPDGRPTNYGFGWGITNYKGLQVLEHGGAAFGFLSTGLRIPSQNLYIVILSNNETSNPYTIGDKLAMHFSGQILISPVKLQPDKKQLEQYIGVYRVHRIGARIATNFTSEPLFRKITVLSDTLYAQTTGNGKQVLNCIGKDLFMFDNGMRLRFNRNKKGIVESLETWFDPIVHGPNEIQVKTKLPLPKEKTAIVLDPKILQQYQGKYAIGQGYTVEINVSGGKIYLGQAGANGEELFPENETTFFLKSRDAYIVFKKVNGKVTEMILNEGIITVCKRID